MREIVSIIYVGLIIADSNRFAAVFPRPYENTFHPGMICPSNICNNIVTDHYYLFRTQVHVLKSKVEKSRRWFSHDHRSFSGCVLKGFDKWPC